MRGNSRPPEQHKRREPSRTLLQSNSSLTVVPTAAQQQPSTPGTSFSAARAPYSHVGIAPKQTTPISPGQLVSATTTTTTTTTTHQTAQASSVHSPSNVQPGVHALADRLQNIHIQQRFIEHRAQAPAHRSLPAPVTSVVGAPQSQPQPVSQPPNPPRSDGRPDPTLLVKQAVNPKYPVTVESRTAAFLEWRSSNASKSQRAINRVKEDYNSGRKDKEIYHELMKREQAQQAQTKLELCESVEDLARKQQRAAREKRRQVQDAERKAVEQQVRQTQQHVQLQSSAQELDRRLQSTVSRQKREERRREREAREQQEAYEEQQAQQRQLAYQQQWAVHGGPDNFGQGMFAGRQAISTTEMAQIVTQVGVGPESGENRKRAIAAGQDATEQLEHRIQTSLSQLGVCPVGFQWVPTADASGYLCCGGNHFMSDYEIDKMLADTLYVPVFSHCNGGGRAVAVLSGMMPPDPPLKKPANQVPKSYFCWRSYETSKIRKDWEATGQAGGLWNAGMGYGF